MSETEHPFGKHYPELRRFGSRAEADTALKACQQMRVTSPWSWLGWIVCAGCVGVTVAATLRVVRIWVPIAGTIEAGIIGGLTAGFSAPVVQWFWRKRYRTLLRLRLVAGGVPICLKCGYDLRGQTEARCPECGTPCGTELLAHNGSWRRRT